MAYGDLSWDQAGERSWGDAAAIYAEQKPVGIFGDLFYQHDAGEFFIDGSAVEVVLVRTGLTITGQDQYGQWQSDPTIVKQAQGMYPVFKAPAGTVVQVSVGAQKVVDEPITWDGPRDFRIGIDKFLDFGVAGEMLAVRFTSSGQPPWELLSYTLGIADIGDF